MRGDCVVRKKMNGFDSKLRSGPGDGCLRWRACLVELLKIGDARVAQIYRDDEWLFEGEYV